MSTDTETPSVPPATKPPYLGRIVYVERAEPSQENTTYYDGSYLIYQETSAELSGLAVSKISVYDLGSGGQHLPLVGSRAYKVLAVDDAGEDILDAVDQAVTNAVDVLTGKVKGNWILSVYEQALSRAIRIRRIVRKQLGLPDVPVSAEVSAPAEADQGDATDVSTLLAPLTELLRPLSIAGASAELHVVFPPASEQERKDETARRSSAQRIADQIAKSRA